MTRSHGPFLGACFLVVVISFIFIFHSPTSRHLSFGDDQRGGLEHDALKQFPNAAGSLSAPYESQKPGIDDADDYYDGNLRLLPAAAVKKPGTVDSSSLSFIRNDFWSVDHGEILPGDVITSLNGLYSMNLSITGELKIFRHYTDSTLSAKPLFWTNNDFQWVGKKFAQVSTDGIFQTWHHILDGDDESWKGNDSTRDAFSEKVKEMDHPLFDKRRLARRGYEPWEGPFRTWSTISYPECQKTPDEGMSAMVALTNTGALQIKQIRTMDLGAFQKSPLPIEEEMLLYPICEVFEGEKEIKTSDMGKLAVVLAGSLRSWKRTCANLNDKVLNQWPGQGGVDVFVATADNDVYDFEDGDEIPWSEIREELNRCLQGRLRLLEHEPMNTVEFPDLEETGGKCTGGTPQDRLLNQVKTVFRGGQLLQQYAIRSGARYDYVLKMRPDHLVWGDAIPPFQHLPHDVISYPMPYWEPPTWSMRHDRNSHSTPSDQMAFGRLLPMMTYFNLYPSYINVVRASQREDGQAYPPCFVPDAPCPDWAWYSPCFIEGLSGYWPVLNGLKIKLDWRWKVALLRRGPGELAKEWIVPWNQTQGTRYVESGFD